MISKFQSFLFCLNKDSRGTPVTTVRPERQPSQWKVKLIRDSSRRNYKARCKSLNQIHLSLKNNRPPSTGEPIQTMSNIEYKNMKIQKYLKHVFKNHKNSQSLIAKRIAHACKTSICSVQGGKIGLLKKSSFSSWLDQEISNHDRNLSWQNKPILNNASSERIVIISKKHKSPEAEKQSTVSIVNPSIVVESWDLSPIGYPLTSKFNSKLLSKPPGREKEGKSPKPKKHNHNKSTFAFFAGHQINSPTLNGSKYKSFYEMRKALMVQQERFRMKPSDYISLRNSTEENGSWCNPPIIDVRFNFTTSKAREESSTTSPKKQDELLTNSRKTVLSKPRTPISETVQPGSQSVKRHRQMRSTNSLMHFLK